LGVGGREGEGGGEQGGEGGEGCEGLHFVGLGVRLLGWVLDVATLVFWI
jgi:hypothetical protein